MAQKFQGGGEPHHSRSILQAVVEAKRRGPKTKPNYDPNYVGGGTKIVNWIADKLELRKAANNINQRGKKAVVQAGAANSKAQKTGASSTQKFDLGKDVPWVKWYNQQQVSKNGQSEADKVSDTQTPDKKTSGTGVKVRRRTPVRPTASPSPVFNKVHVGGRVDNTRLNNIDKQKLINIGFNNEDFDSVTNFQNAVNRYYNKANLGSVKVDNKWGNQTQAAYEKLLSDANKQLDQYSIKAADDGAPTVPESLTTSKPAITVNNTSVEPRNNYNRADTRDVIRLWGRNPYSYGGLQRRSFRHYLNGNATDKDLRRVQSMGLFNPYPSAKSTTTLMPQYNLDNYFYNWMPQFTNQNQAFNYQ